MSNTNPSDALYPTEEDIARRKVTVLVKVPELNDLVVSSTLPEEYDEDMILKGVDIALKQSVNFIKEEYRKKAHSNENTN